MDGQAVERSGLRRCAAVARRHGSLARLRPARRGLARHAATRSRRRAHRAESGLTPRAAPSLARALADARRRAFVQSINEHRGSGSMLSTAEPEVQPDAVVADAPFSNLSTRMHQMFPELTAAEIDRVRKFGEVGQWQAGELLFETGHTGPGMFVLLEGRVKISQRDGIGREVVIGEHGPGHFLAEVGQLSGRHALVNGMALTHVKALLIPPERLRALLVAEAELGERIMRALILRRV